MTKSFDAEMCHECICTMETLHMHIVSAILQQIRFSDLLKLYLRELDKVMTELDITNGSFEGSECLRSHVDYIQTLSELTYVKISVGNSKEYEWLLNKRRLFSLFSLVKAKLSNFIDNEHF